jgi:predicted CoA-substrate-specific enzyme activase
MYYMGVDVGSVSTNVVLLDNTLKVIEKLYLRTKGKPIKAIQLGMEILSEKYHNKQIRAVGTTGSGRQMASFLIGADIVKNEITAHAVASLEIDKDVSTILEIGGQDSKIILLKNGIVTDFAMNTVCAAGTGSFLDRQAERLEIPIENFGEYALKSKAPVRIAGRCAVFAESDMIHKQQLGYNEQDIIGGLCEALVRNYLSNVGKGKDIRSKIFFQGGVAANSGIKAAFEKALRTEIYVPEHYDVMGAIGAAILAKENLARENKTNFKGFEIATNDFVPRNIECNGCGNNCEVIAIKDGEKTVGCFGDRCGKWSSKMA